MLFGEMTLVAVNTLLHLFSEGSRPQTPRDCDHVALLQLRAGRAPALRCPQVRSRGLPPVGCPWDRDSNRQHPVQVSLCFLLGLGCFANYSAVEISEDLHKLLHLKISEHPRSVTTEASFGNTYHCITNYCLSHFRSAPRSTTSFDNYVKREYRSFLPQRTEGRHTHMLTSGNGLQTNKTSSELVVNHSCHSSCKSLH